MCDRLLLVSIFTGWIVAPSRFFLEALCPISSRFHGNVSVLLCLWGTRLAVRSLGHKCLNVIRCVLVLSVRAAQFGQGAAMHK